MAALAPSSSMRTSEFRQLVGGGGKPENRAKSLQLSRKQPTPALLESSLRSRAYTDLTTRLLPPHQLLRLHQLPLCPL